METYVFSIHEDDIDLEDTKEKHKGLNLAVLDKQKLGKKLHALKGQYKMFTLLIMSDSFGTIL